MKTYYVVFGTGDVRSNVGLSPTFLIFNNNGTNITAPGISPVIGATGFYSFQYGVTTPICFLIDGATTGLSASNRYISGSIDPADRTDEYAATMIALGNTIITQLNNEGSTLVAFGNTSVALGQSGIALGNTAVALGNTGVALGNTIFASVSNVTLMTFIGTPTGSTFGSSSADPIDIFGYLKRVQENLEGNQSFTKMSGALSIYSRGSSTLLIAKSIANNVSMVIKT